MKIADRVSLEFTLGGGFAFDLRQPRNPVPLQTPMKWDERRQMRDAGGLAGRKRQSSSGNSVCLRKAMTTASSSTDKTVDRGALSPVGRSETEVRAFHLAIVFGLTP